MIYTVTFNPSLDYIVSVDHFTCGIVNRTKDEIIFPGGKGINVSMVLKNLGFENTALGFLAGFTGDRIEEQVMQSEHGHLHSAIRLISLHLTMMEWECQCSMHGQKITR